MSLRTLYRLSATALLIGSLFFSIGIAMRIVLFFPDLGNVAQIRNPLWVPVSVGIFSGFLLLAAGLPGMYTYQTIRTGWLGLVGFVLTFFGVILFSGLYVVDFAVLPGLVPEASRLAAGHLPPITGLEYVYRVAVGMLFGGFAVLGSAVVSTDVPSRWAGWLLIGGVFIGLAYSLPLPAVVIELIAIAENVLPVLGLGCIGYTLWSDAARVHTSLV